jgi:hypothetical protein
MVEALEMITGKRYVNLAAQSFDIASYLGNPAIASRSILVFVPVYLHVRTSPTAHLA